MYQNVIIMKNRILGLGLSVLFFASCTGQLNWISPEPKGDPVARHENCFLECKGKFYLAGGRGIKPVNIYDPASNTWTDGTKPPIELHHFQAVSYKDKIWMVGVMTGKYPNEVPVPNIYIYDPATDSWETGDEVPADRQRGSSGVVIYKDKFYIVCGIADGHNGDHKTWVDTYDPGTGRWEILPDAPNTRDHFHAVVIKNKIYAAGGRNTSKNTNQVFDLVIPEVDVFDLKKQTWETLPESSNLPTLRAGTSAVNFKGNLLVIGGESMAHKEAHNEVEALDPKTGIWEPKTSLNRGRHGTQAVVYKGKIYTASGSGNRGGGPELKTIEIASFE